MLLACGVGVLSVGLRDSANPRALLELSHVRKICSDLRKHRTAVEDSEQRLLGEGVQQEASRSPGRSGEGGGRKQNQIWLTSIMLTHSGR